MTTRKSVSLIEPSLKFLSVIPTMCGLSVCGVTGPGPDDAREPDLYDTKSEWYLEQADLITAEAAQVSIGAREPNECGSDEELVMVLVYPDGRIIDASDLVTDYRVIFDRDNTS